MTLTTNVPESGQTISQSAEALRLATEVLSDDGESIEWKRIAGQLDKPEVGLAELRHALSCGSAALTQRFLNGERECGRHRLNLVEIPFSRRRSVHGFPQLPLASL